MAAPIRYSREREYAMTVSEAWRLLADTNHLNRSVGLPSVDFSPLDGANGHFVRTARARAFGLVPLRWKEYPFDWIRDQRYVVRREFDWGPVKVLEGAVELLPVEDRVRVRVSADFTPANVTGRLFWRLGAGVVRNTLEFCDAYLQRKQQGYADPIPSAGTPAVDAQRLERLAERLAQRPVAPELLATLVAHVREAGDDRVLRMRAFELADRWGADRSETLRLFLHAASLGLLQLAWQLMCPNCRVPKSEGASLTSLPARFHCDTCGIVYDTELDRRVELRFSVDPRVRRASDAIYCIGGPLRMPHVLAQQFLRPNETRSLSLPWSEVPLRIRAVGSNSGLRIAGTPPGRRVEEVSLIYAAGKWTGPLSRTTATNEGDTLSLPDGCSLLLRNQTAGPLLAVLEDVRWADVATTAATALGLPEFQSLFPGERWNPRELLDPDIPADASVRSG